MDERRTLLGIGAAERDADPAGAPAQPDQPAPTDPPPPQDPGRALAAVTPLTSEQPETWSRRFVATSLRRAFRLQIKTDEVLPSERAHLESEASHIRDPEQQAFLAWRRSVLLLVAIMFVPLTVSRFIETFQGLPVPRVARAFNLLPALAELGFCVVAFVQLRNWAQWKRQRRILFIAWALYFLAPFLVYLYPWRSAFGDSVALAQMAVKATNMPIAMTRANYELTVGLVFGVTALIMLGPKLISLMPGLIRASIVTKLLFPGTTAPGWLMVLAAPFYAMFAYVIVVLPYQVTGSWQFMAGNVGLLGAQVYIGISGRRLTEPLSAEESHHRIHRSWLIYIAVVAVSACFLVYGLYDFVTELHLGAARVVTGVLAFVSNVLLDTLIGTDAIVSAMAHLRRRSEPDPRHQQLLRDAEVKLETFCA